MKEVILVQIKKGKNRIVFIFPSIGIVFKFSIIHFLTGLHILYRHIKRGHWEFIKEEWGWPVDNHALGGWKNYFFRGLVINWNEFQFYRQTHNPFLQPTYLSLGFLNIQRYGEPCNLNANDFLLQLTELTDYGIWDDSHHFGNPNNFSLTNGVLRILDYGSHYNQKVILKYGTKIVQMFNPTYKDGQRPR